MNILQIITGLNYGGAEKLLLDICIELKEQNENVVVVYLKSEGKMVSEFRNHGIAVYKCDIEKNVFRAIFQIHKIIKQKKINIVHTHLIHADLLGRFVTIFNRVNKVFTTMHSTDPWRSSSKIRYKLLKWIERAFLRRSNYYAIAISEGVKKYHVFHEKLPAEKIFVLHNVISTKRIDELSKVEISKEILENIKGNFVIANVGRLSKAKGHTYLISAIEELVNKKNIKQMKCFIIGEGDEWESLQNQVRKANLEDYISFLGLQQNVYSYLVHADIFVMPSVYEGFGIAALEALYLGIPVIASNVEGLNEIIIDGKTGIQTLKQNPHSLAQAIEKIYFDKDKKYTKYIIHNGKEEADKYNVETYINKLLYLYNK